MLKTPIAHIMLATLLVVNQYEHNNNNINRNDNVYGARFILAQQHVFFRAVKLMH